MTALAALGGAVAGLGLLLVAVGIVGTRGAPASDVGHRLTRPPLTRLRTVGAGWSRRRLAVTLAAPLVALVVTGWLVAGLLALVAALLVPAMLAGRGTAAARLGRLQALADWTRRLADVLTAGIGLEQALEASLRTVPAPLEAPVGRLVARLRARRPLAEALRGFADDLDDPTGDLVVAALLLAADRRGRGLAVMLTGLAVTVEHEVAMRRAVDADRAAPRTTARWVTGITLVVTGALVVFDRSYVTPFGSPAGQVVLALIGALFGAAFWWMHHLTNPAPAPRFLPNPSSPRPAVGAGPLNGVVR